MVSASESAAARRKEEEAQQRRANALREQPFRDRLYNDLGVIVDDLEFGHYRTPTRNDDCLVAVYYKDGGYTGLRIRAYISVEVRGDPAWNPEIFHHLRHSFHVYKPRKSRFKFLDGKMKLHEIDLDQAIAILDEAVERYEAEQAAQEIKPAEPAEPLSNSTWYLKALRVLLKAN